MDARHVPQPGDRALPRVECNLHQLRAKPLDPKIYFKSQSSPGARFTIKPLTGEKAIPKP